MRSFIIRIIAVLLITVEIVIYTKVIDEDIFVVKSLFQDISNQEYNSKVIYGLPYYEPAERVAVGYYNYQLKQNLSDCKTIIEYSKQLLKMNSRSSQAYYAMATCAEVNGDLPSSINLMKDAIKYDPLNTTYLSGLALLNISIGNYTEGTRIFNTILSIDPYEPRINDIRALLDK